MNEISEKLVDLCHKFQTSIIDIEDELNSEEIQWLAGFLVEMADDLPDPDEE